MGNFMFRSLFIGALLTALVLASGSASVAVASEAQPTLNIGFVLYSKGNVPGTLNARWTYQNIYSAMREIVAASGISRPIDGAGAQCKFPCVIEGIRQARPAFLS